MHIKIWSADTGVCPVTLTGHTMAVTDIAIVDRGRNIVSVSKDGTAKLWHCGEAKCLGNIIKVTSSINCCKIHTASSTLDLGEPQTKTSDLEINTEKRVLLIGCEDGSVYCIGIRSRKVLFILEHESEVNCVAFLNPEQFIVGCQNGKICLYNVNRIPKPDNVWHESNSAILCLLEHTEKGFFASRADGSVVFRSILDSSKYLALSGPNYDPVYDISFDGKHLYTSCRDAVIRKYVIKPIICKFEQQ
ncbi:hypothetical protein AAG570_011569 [Ranatra chinensis]|uniref:Proteasomal ATPase-associated factor 1 n=1 Tax=Ranatra chinensis TaxID=642074 RepID=A0ABD0YL10_9HEMI